VPARQRRSPLVNKIVTAFTHADDDNWLPPRFVVGKLAVQHVTALDYGQHLVDGTPVDKTTIVSVPNAGAELLSVLKEKALAWERQDRQLAKKRGRMDGRFRDDHVDPEYEVVLVREDQWEAFSTFCHEMDEENARLTMERQAEVAELIREFEKRKAKSHHTDNRED
jgi:hypothetical protein